MADVKAVSLHVIVEFKGKLYAVCQRRGCLNFEKSDWRETWPGGTQPLVHGKLEDGESPREALAREAKGEAGVGFAEETLALCANIDPFIEGKTAHWGVKVDMTALTLIRLEPISGGLVLVDLDQAKHVQPLKDYPKDQLIAPNVIAMFADDASIMVRFLEAMTEEAAT